MTVFKGFLQVLLRNIAFVILFTTIMVVMGLTAFQTSPVPPVISLLQNLQF